jgi:hypothetical protein
MGGDVCRGGVAGVCIAGVHQRLPWQPHLEVGKLGTYRDARQYRVEPGYMRVGWVMVVIGGCVHASPLRAVENCSY